MSDRTDEIAAAILQTCAVDDPLALRKADLLAMRQRAIELATQLLEPVVLPTVRVGTPDPDYLLALRFVANYAGPNRFMRDLREVLDRRGSLTQGQVEAVLASPTEVEREEMEQVGLEGVLYRWQALDALRAERSRLRAAAREDAAAGRMGP